MGIAIGAGIAVAGGLSYMGSQQSARAAGDAAEAQAAQASANRATITAYSDKWHNQVTNLANATPQELSVLNQSYAAASKSLEQQQQLMASIDPSLMEASKQALQILRGGQAASQQPIMNLRNQQRSQLVNSLRSQHGPGAELSSVGQRALQNFDMQTNMLQQQTLGNLMGIATNPNPGQNLQRSISGMEEVGQGYGNLQTRALNAEINVGNSTLGALGGVGQQMLQTAGAPYVGAALQGQGMSNLGNNFMQAGMMYGMTSGWGNGAAPSGK